MTQPCESCEGEGGWIVTGRSWSGDDLEGWATCPECHGFGYLEGEPEPISLDESDQILDVDELVKTLNEIGLPVIIFE